MCLDEKERGNERETVRKHKMIRVWPNNKKKNPPVHMNSKTLMEKNSIANRRRSVQDERKKRSSDGKRIDSHLIYKRCESKWFEGVQNILSYSQLSIEI